jgi:hypothetical protein
MNLLLNGDTKTIILLAILLIITLFLIIRGFKNKSSKNIELIKHVSLFALVFGFYTLFYDLLQMFEVIAIANDASHGVIAIGLGYAVSAPTLGMLIFLIGRLGIIYLTWSKKE